MLDRRPALDRELPCFRPPQGEDVKRVAFHGEAKILGAVPANMGIAMQKNRGFGRDIDSC